ncbi:MAG: pantetheine-phosphate adenylyltransferase [Phycisphaerales bacterium]
MTVQPPPAQLSSAPHQHHLAIYTGSFDPITFGHLDVLARSRRLFDEVIVAIGRNPNKAALFSFEERTELARALVDELVRHDPSAAKVRVETYTGLTVDFAQSVGAAAIIRGIRNVSDLASECQLAITNRQVAGIETVFIVTGEAFAYTSSSLIQQIAALGGSLDKLNTLVPPIVIDALRRKREDHRNPLGRLAQDQLIE